MSENRVPEVLSKPPVSDMESAYGYQERDKEISMTTFGICGHPRPGSLCGALIPKV